MKIFVRRKDKSGSLQLSINAIVILVMAMVVLGLGLGFIKGLFSKGTVNLSKAIENNQLDTPATVANPLTVDKTASVKAGGTTRLRIGFYNKFNEEKTVSPVPNGGITAELLCADAYGDEITIIITSAEVTIAPGDSTGFEAILTLPDDGADSGLIICPLVMSVSGETATPSTQFYIEVI